MNIEDLVKLSPILVNIIVSFVSILATHEISKHTINNNRKLNEENAKINAVNVGKNRIIYGVEEMIIDSSDSLKKLNEKLNSESYAILAVSTNLSNFSQRIYSLGKIKL